MARARKVDLDCEEPFALAAARIVEMRAAEVFEHSSGVLDLDDIERLHDMRVATRRLRAAMEVFAPCFPRKRHRKALKQVKELADVLGERRDRDVSIKFLEGLGGDLPPEDRDGLGVLVADLRKEQVEANDELARFVKPKRLKSLRRRLGRLVESVER